MAGVFGFGEHDLARKNEERLVRRVQGALAKCEGRSANITEAKQVAT